MGKMTSDLVAIFAFLMNLVFFIWFGSTLGSINRHLEDMTNIAKYTSELTKHLARLTPSGRTKLLRRQIARMPSKNIARNETHECHSMF